MTLGYFLDSQWRRRENRVNFVSIVETEGICTCIINETSTRDSVRRVSGSWRRFARTSNAAFEDSPATALLLLVLHAHNNNFHIHGLLLVSEKNNKSTMAGWERRRRRRRRESDERERRGRNGVGCLCFWLISISSMQFCGTLPPVGHLFRLNFYVKSMFDECWVFNLLFDWNAIPHEILTFWNHLVTFQFLTCY